jgi:hypothetical protein
MQTSRFQITVIAMLAAGLGYLGSSRTAVGYPAGPVVSYGANPVVSYGGTVASETSVSALTAPSDQAFIVTDLVLTGSDTGSQCRGVQRLSLVSSSGTVGVFSVGLAWGYGGGTSSSSTAYEQQVVVNMQSGVRVEAGDTLSLSSSHRWSSSCGGAIDVDYTLAGYYAQP